MSRPLRIEYENAYYHVMNRGRGRKAIFHDENYFSAFLCTLAEAQVRFGIEIHAYCLMTNHYHLLLKTPRGNLQRAMRHIGGVYTQRYNRLKKTDGSLFRGRYKAILVDSDAYLLHLSKYIHLNPISANMVDELKDYKWSSYPSYIKRAKRASWLYCDEVYEQLGYRSRLAKQYKTYVEEYEQEDEVIAFYKKQRQPPIFGSEAFIERVKKKKNKLTNEVSRRSRKQIMPSKEEIAQAVASEFESTVTELLISKKGRSSKNKARKLLMYSLQRIGEYRLTEISDYMGLTHYGSISNAIFEVKQWLMEDSKLRKRLNNVINRFDP